MKCTHCRYSNSEGEHRCSRCGRRLAEQIAAETAAVHRTTGNLAAAPVIQPREPQPAAAPARQRSLFSDRTEPKVIPFPSATAHFIEILQPANESQPEPIRTVSKRRTAPRAGDRQPSLDFLPPAPAAPRRLKTNVEAVIYCDAPVAAPRHRATAAVLDATMIFAAFGIFLSVFHFMGGIFSINSRTAAMFAAAFGVIAGLYGLLWVLSGRETPGMRWVHLRLIDFDGFVPDARKRVQRYAGVWLSFCSLGMGLLWALLDEEHLTWQDHMSHTFPTLRESNSSFVRKT